MAKYTRSKTTDFTTSGGVVTHGDLFAEVKAATGVFPEQLTEDDDGDKVHFDFGQNVLDATQQTTLTTACNDHGDTPLDAAKKAKVESIDYRTRELINAGFEYPAASGVYFSLSTNGQASLLGLEAARDDVNFSYPVEWNSKNDKTKQNIADSTNAHGFFMTALATVRGHLDSGTALKDSVRTASTIAEVDAVVDNR